VYAVAFCLIAGFGVKGALLPLHGWLPQAMVAPTPVSGLLHAVAVVKSGVFSILRTMFCVLGPSLLARSRIDVAIAWVAGVSILLASVTALRQDVLKRRLAYSTISQLAYISLGASTLTGAGMMGGLLHLLMHAVMKITLFLAAGIIIVRTGRTRVSQLDGIGRVLPWTMGAFAVASVAMVGIPPLAGFVPKWHLLTGGLAAGRPWVTAVVAVSSILNAAYLFPIVTRAFFRPWGPAAGAGEADHPPPVETQTEAPWSMLGPVLALAAACVALGLWPAWPTELVRRLVGMP
jgi:multicomponent Na+:H+ antiporter subunit D